MHKEFRMGNEAIALGAIAAGVNLISGYPGTPSTEVLETVAKNRTNDCYVEWSVNEKVAMEVAAGAAYSGARVMVTMKHFQRFHALILHRHRKLMKWYRRPLSTRKNIKHLYS